MARITISDLNKVSFYQIPKSFYHNPEYITMSSEAKLAYALLYDLLDLSAKNDWVNDEGEVYIKLSREKLMLRLNIGSKTTAAKVMKELIKKGLIEERRVGVNKCNEIYMCTPNELSKIYKDDDLLVFKEEIKEEKKKKKPLKHSNTNGSTKNGLQEVQKMDDQKMDFKKSKNCTHTNTKFTKTKFSSSNIDGIEKIFIEAFGRKPSINMTRKLKLYTSKSSNDFIIEVINYSIDHGAKTPTYLLNTLQKLIVKGITTIEDFHKSINEFYNNKEKKNDSDINKNTYKNKSKKDSNNANFTQRDYDFDDLERRLLGWDE